MKFLWKKNVNKVSWLGGIFCKAVDGVTLYTEGIGQVLAFTEKDGKQFVLYEEDSQHNLLPPNQWRTVSDAYGTYLYCDKTMLLPLGEEPPISPVPLTDEYADALARSGCTSSYLSNAKEYPLGEYTVRRISEWIYQCEKQSVPLWKFRTYAYLYTDFWRTEDRLFFGTDGQGGYFYILDLHSGEALCRLKTGGTNLIVCRGSHCYVYLRGKRSKVVCVDLKTGAILDEQELEGYIYSDSPLACWNERLYTLTYQIKDGLSHPSAIITCIDISAHQPDLSLHPIPSWVCGKGWKNPENFTA